MTLSFIPARSAQRFHESKLLVISMCIMRLARALGILKATDLSVVLLSCGDDYAVLGQSVFSYDPVQGDLIGGRLGRVEVPM